MGAAGAAIGVAETRYREERVRPFLPLFWMGVSGGGFGGGSNLVQPLLGNFGGRTDFDVRAIWTLQNLGLGNLSQQKRRRAMVGQAQAEQSRTVNTIRREVAQAQAVAIAQVQPIEQARRGLRLAEEGFRDDLTRTRNAQGRPLEVLNSLSLVTRARLDLVRAVTALNQAQLALFVSLGSPPPVEGPPGPPPGGPPPVSTPLHSPIVSGG